MNHSRTLILVGVSVLLSTNAIAQTTPGSGIRVSKDNPASTTTTTTTTTTTIVVSGGDVNLVPAFSLSAYASLSEANIAAHLLGGDSLEIRVAQLAQSKATDQRVRDFAMMLINDHATHLSRTSGIVTDEHIANVPIPNDVEAQRMLQLITNLTAMPTGSAWDAAFVRSQIQHHQNEIDLLNANMKNAHDDDFEDLVEDTLVSLGKHRDAGRSLATTLGIAPY